MNLQQAVSVTDSTFLLCRAREEILRERRAGAFISSVRIHLPAEDVTEYFRNIDKQRRIDLNEKACAFREA